MNELFVNPYSWGNGAWIFLHCITYAYPEFPTEQEQKHYCAFFMNLGNVIPCPSCREHYIEWCKKFPCSKFLKNRMSLSKWLYEMHNFVNFKLNKPLIDNFETSQKLIMKQILYQQEKYNKSNSLTDSNNISIKKY